MTHRLVWLSACMTFALFLSASNACAVEYYLDVDGYPVDKKIVHIDDDSFPGFLAIRNRNASFFLASFVDGFTLGFIEGFIIQNHSVSRDNNGSKYTLIFSSSDRVFEKISEIMKEMSSVSNSNLYESFTTNRDCFSLGITDSDGQILVFQMFVTDGRYSSYFHCLRQHYQSFKQLLAN